MLQKIKVKLLYLLLKIKRNFRSILDKKTNTVKTIKYNNFTLDDFFKEIYTGLHSLFKKDIIIPESVDVKKLEDNTKYDKESNIIFNKTQNLFDILMMMIKKLIYLKMINL